jgi:hypothetical protein
MEIYGKGTEILSLFAMRRGTVIRKCECTSSTVHYEVQWDDGVSFIGHSEIAPVEHSIHKTIAYWRADMEARGYRYIICGKNPEGKLVAVYFNDPDEYGRMCRSKPGVTWIHYWAL